MLHAKFVDCSHVPPHIVDFTLKFSQPPTLHLLLEWGRRQARERLRVEGYLGTKVVCVRQRDAQALWINLDNAFARHSKEAAWGAVKLAIQHTGGDMALVMSEMWAVEGAADGFDRSQYAKSLADDPRRKEVVWFTAETRTQQIIERYPIVRDRQNRPRLGNQTAFEGRTETCGNAVGLLYQAPPSTHRVRAVD